MNEKQQTAVQWLIDKIRTTPTQTLIYDSHKIFEMALELEREQIELSWIAGRSFYQEKDAKIESANYFIYTYQTEP